MPLTASTAPRAAPRVGGPRARLKAALAGADRELGLLPTIFANTGRMGSSETVMRLYRALRGT
jgi:hypothetical protein